jgi:hypothetical protein
MDGLRALDVMALLQERLAVLTGGRDRRGGPVLSFPATPRRERAKPDDYRRLLQYLLAIPWSVKKILSCRMMSYTCWRKPHWTIYWYFGEYNLRGARSEPR